MINQEILISKTIIYGLDCVISRRLGNSVLLKEYQKRMCNNIYSVDYGFEEIFNVYRCTLKSVKDKYRYIGII